jgi:hypothetical protein
VPTLTGAHGYVTCAEQTRDGTGGACLSIAVTLNRTLYTVHIMYIQLE